MAFSSRGDSVKGKIRKFWGRGIYNGRKAASIDKPVDKNNTGCQMKKNGKRNKNLRTCEGGGTCVNTIKRCKIYWGDSKMRKGEWVRKTSPGKKFTRTQWRTMSGAKERGQRGRVLRNVSGDGACTKNMA